MVEKKISFEEALNRASSLCAASEKCCADISDKLLTLGADRATVEQVCEKLISEGFIDEERYARVYVKDKFRFNKWGKVKLKLMLQMKHIEPVFIEEALNLIDKNEYELVLFDLLSAKLRSISFHSDYEKQGKLFRFAQGRGFEVEVIKEVYQLLN